MGLVPLWEDRLDGPRRYTQIDQDTDGVSRGNEILVWLLDGQNQTQEMKGWEKERWTVRRGDRGSPRNDLSITETRTSIGWTAQDVDQCRYATREFHYGWERCSPPQVPRAREPKLLITFCPLVGFVFGGGDGRSEESDSSRTPITDTLKCPDILAKESGLPLLPKIRSTVLNQMLGKVNFRRSLT
ncbi:hypothetical protein RRG08_001052 [Elysia crispata]|uniref:Uncharacterized protein n=1 Tax=Elysia crispata TaxID=231223 RepID=A0AAE1AVS5_9GAST|nr:hypothetical protein RRG08_001052 [Elysia crispata]